MQDPTSATGIGLAAPEPDVLRPLDFDTLEGWSAADHTAAFRAFRSGAAGIAARPPTTGTLGIRGEALRVAAQAAAQRCDQLSPRLAKAFFETFFAPHRIDRPGFVTGYFEPEVVASRTADAGFKVPLYRRPDDLIEVVADDRPAGWDPAVGFGTRRDGRIVPYADRRAIENGALAGRGLEIAWLESAVDAFFVHVQGSARLRLRDGGTLRVGYDGKSGHPYTSIAKRLVEQGILPLERADKAGLEAWLRAHPDAAREAMWENRSFIFFRTLDLPEESGPLGAAGVPLIAGRSLAVDCLLHTFHTPIWLTANDVPDPEENAKPFRRLMISHDTGSAITGPARADIFYGSGAAAGERAGSVRHPATMVLLVPRP